MIIDLYFLPLLTYEFNNFFIILYDYVYSKSSRVTHVDF